METIGNNLGLVIGLGVAGLVLLCMVVSSIFTIETYEVGIVQRMGKFHVIAQAGLNFKIPFLDDLVDTVSLQVEQLEIPAETKTKDNVFVKVPITVQYRVVPEKVYDAFYKLSDPEEQIKAFVLNVVLGHVPKLDLDAVFAEQSQIAIDVQKSLDASMEQYGYTIVNALITDVVPDEKVAEAMNDINAAVREREATVSRAETNKLLLVKNAEAESESKRLQGVGVAAQRKAIVEGLRESVEAFAESVEGATPRDAMAMVMMTQYFDMLSKVSGENNSNTILMPHTPNAIGDLLTQFRNAIITGDLASVPAQELHRSVAAGK